MQFIDWLRRKFDGQLHSGVSYQDGIHMHESEIEVSCLGYVDSSVQVVSSKAKLTCEGELNSCLHNSISRLTGSRLKYFALAESQPTKCSWGWENGQKPLCSPLSSEHRMQRCLQSPEEWVKQQGRNYRVVGVKDNSACGGYFVVQCPLSTGKLADRMVVRCSGSDASSVNDDLSWRPFDVKERSPDAACEKRLVEAKWEWTGDYPMSACSSDA